MVTAFSQCHLNWSTISLFWSIPYLQKAKTFYFNLGPMIMSAYYKTSDGVYENRIKLVLCRPTIISDNRAYKFPYNLVVL